jgi:hypothetical protein
MDISDKRVPPKNYKVNKKMHLRIYVTPPTTQYTYSELHINILSIKYFGRHGYLQSPWRLLEIYIYIYIYIYTRRKRFYMWRVCEIKCDIFQSL